MSAIVWRPIPGFEGRYDVSDQGQVRSWLPYQGKPVPRPRPTYINTWGYPSLSLRDKEGRQATWSVYRLVALAFLGPPPDKQEVRHLDGDRVNSDLRNLAYGSRSENQFDRVRHGNHHNANKTHCLNGHELVGWNILPSKKNRRCCRVCHYARDRAYYASRKAV